MAHPQQPSYPSAPSGYPSAGPNWQQARSAQGSSKTLPIAIGTGLAVGVFVGLLVIRGTGDSAAGTHASSDDIDAAMVTTTGATVDAAPPPVLIDAAAKPDAAVKAVKSTATLTFDIEDSDSLEQLEVLVDDVPIEGQRYTVDFDPNDRVAQKVSVRVKVRAKGRQSYRKKIVIDGDQTLAITLKKRPSGGKHPSKPNGHGGDIIDL